jgi:RNA polymerase sigma-70 factor, ECF subfamily
MATFTQALAVPYRPPATPPSVLEGEAAVAPRTFPAVYAAHLDLVWRSLRSLGVPPASVEDAAQDVFLVVHRRLPEFAERSSLRTWVFGIVLHVARNHRRRERRKGGLCPLDTELAGGGPGPDQEAETAEALERLAEVLGDLDEAKREVFVMGELEQMTAPEIAEALGINVNTVYSRVRAARLAFTAALARRQGGRR